MILYAPEQVNENVRKKRGCDRGGFICLKKMQILLRILFFLWYNVREK